LLTEHVVDWKYLPASAVAKVKSYPVSAELELLKDDLRLAGLLPSRPRLIYWRLPKDGGRHFVTLTPVGWSDLNVRAQTHNQ